MSDLLVAIAIDFDGSGRVGARAKHIGESLRHGAAGNVRWAQCHPATLFARKRSPVARPRIARTTLARAADGGVTLFAGRLFERDALAGLLGYKGAGVDDAGLYSAAHERFGEDCDRRVIGDYAAVRWFPDARRLRIARSPTSRHPIHLWRDGGQLVAASLPRALFAAGAPDALDPEALDDYLMVAGPMLERSFYKSCSRVPAAHVLIADPGGQRMRRYWSIADAPRVRLRRDEDYVAAVDSQMQRALSAEVATAKCPAVSLSGGFDSQAVAAYALQALPADAKLKTFTAVPMEGWRPSPRPARFGDESEHVRALAAMYPRIEPHFVSAAEVAFGDGLDRRMMLSSWPSYNELNAHWALSIAKAAAEAGCDVLLCGDFGNFSFSYDGWTGYPEWFARGKWLHLLREVAHSGDPRPFPRAVFSRAVWPHVPNRLRLWRDRANPWHVSPYESWCPMREEHAIASGVVERARSRGLNVDGYDPTSSRRLREDMWRWMVGGAPEVALGQTLTTGIAISDPTAFVPLVELCAGIPDEQYLRGGTDRWLARRLLKDKVPEMVRCETRTGAQSADWPIRLLRERTGLVAEIDRMNADPRLARVFDFERMRRSLLDWDGTDDASLRNYFAVAMCATRGISAARFVHLTEGRNA